MLKGTVIQEEDEENLHIALLGYTK